MSSSVARIGGKLVKELVGLKVRAKEERGKLSSLIKFQFGMGGEGEEEGANLIGWSFSCFRFQYAHKIASLEAMQVQNYNLLSYNNGADTRATSKAKEPKS